MFTLPESAVIANRLHLLQMPIGSFERNLLTGITQMGGMTVSEPMLAEFLLGISVETLQAFEGYGPRVNVREAIRIVNEVLPQYVYAICPDERASLVVLSHMGLARGRA